MDSSTTTPLLAENATNGAHQNGASATVEDLPPVRSFSDARQTFIAESKKLWAIALPIVFNMLCLYGFNSSTQIFVGHIGNLQLSAVAIGLSVVSTFSFGILLGMASALETLCGQAYGAKQLEMMGLYMQRSWIILLATAVVMIPIYVFATPVLRLLGQEPEIATLAGRFTVQIIPQMIALAVNFPTQKFLQAQGKVVALAWIGFAGLALHIGLLALFIFVFRWDVGGAAAAYNISWWLVSLSQAAYCIGWCKDAWRGWSWDAFRGIWAFVRLSIASAVMLCLELWYMMILVVLTGHLKNAELAIGSISICMNINGWEGMLFIGVNAGISVRVSNELGAGRPRATKYAVIVVVLTSLFIGLFFMVLILATRNHFAVIFTSDAAMQQAVAKVAYLLAVTMVLNSIQPVISGVAVGGGWQALVAYINLGSYYVFGLPLGFILGYLLGFGVQGIWSGMLCGTILQTLILLYVVWRTDWKIEAAQASARMMIWGGHNKQQKLEA